MQIIDLEITSCFHEKAFSVWQNETYLAAAYRENEYIRLDICRNDCKDGITWDEMREIKNQCGFSDVDAMEFYPKESDVINTGNIRHLYISSVSLPLIKRI